MKKSFAVAFMVCAIILMGAGSALAEFTITFDEAAVTPATDDRSPIETSGAYDHLGIHFLTDTTGLTDPVLLYYDSTILPPGSVNNVFQYPQDKADDGSNVDYADYPYPETQYLAIDKPDTATDTDGITGGVALRFDYSCTRLTFKCRKPGKKDTSTDINVAYFDTGDGTKDAFDSELITAYVYAPAVSDPDGDGWVEYTLAPVMPFDLVTLTTSEKQFAMDDLTVTTVPNDDGTYPEDTVDAAPGDSDTDPVGPDDSGTSKDGDNSGGCFISSLF